MHVPIRGRACAQIRVGTAASKVYGDTYVVDIRRGGRGRAGSPLGNPFVLTDQGDDRARDACCNAYEDLLYMTACQVEGSAFELTPSEVAEFGERRGFRGQTRAWDGTAARLALAHIADVSRARDVLLRCQCRPRRCHGESVAHHAHFMQVWDEL